MIAIIKRLKTCEVCSQTFDKKGLLKEHMKLHDEKDSSKETEESHEIDDKFNPQDDTYLQSQRKPRLLTQWTRMRCLILEHS